MKQKIFIRENSLSNVSVLEKVQKASIYVVAFLIPLWFLPLTQDALNPQKQIVLMVCVIAGLASWIAKIFIQKELKIRWHWFYLPLLLLLVTTAVSSATSLFPHASLWGYPLSIPDSFLTISFFALLSFLALHIIDSEKDLFLLFTVFIGSVALAGLYALLQMYHVFVIPFSFARAVAFNTIGSPNSIAMLAAILLPLALALALVAKKQLRPWSWLLVAVLLAMLLLINFIYSWVVLIGGIIVFLAFGIWNLKRSMNFGLISFCAVLVVVSLFFLVFHVSFPGSPVLSLEVSPSIGAELHIAKSALQKNIFFGTGPGTFIYDYAQYRQKSLNQTIFWDARFSSGASEILDWIITKGILGALALIVLIVVIIAFAVRRLMVLGDNEFSWVVGPGLLASFIGISLALILYWTNFTTWFLFWLLVGALGAYIARAEKKFSVAQGSFQAIIVLFVFLLVLVFGAGLLLVEGQKYIAQVQYAQGAAIIGRGQLDRGIAKILSSVSLDPSVDLYWRDLSQLYLSQLNQIISNDKMPNEQKTQQARIALANATASINRAITLSPNNVANWNVRGFVYANLIGIQGADVLAIQSYERANELEPSSPFALTELGRVYLAQAQNFASSKDAVSQQNALNKAFDNLQNAIALKSDYAPANYLIALVYGQQGKSDEEIARLESTRALVPDDIGVAFELGVLYYQKNQIDKAQVIFESIKQLNPNYANGRYMLGLAYDAGGQKDKALAEFNKVQSLNPGNSQIGQIISNVNAGKPALSGLGEQTPSIQENPPEISGQKGK